MLWREDKTLGKLLSCVQLFATPWTVAYQAPPSMGFSKWLRLRAYSTGDTASIPRGIEIGRSPITFTLWTILIKYFSASIKKKKKNTGVGCHFLLQEIFPTQGSNLSLLHCRQTLCHLSHQGTPGFNPWVGKISWRRKWQSTPAFLPGESHRQKSLVSPSPRGCKDFDTTEQLTLHSSETVS